MSESNATVDVPRDEESGPLLLPPPARRGRFAFWVRLAVGLILTACIAVGWATWKFVEPRYAAITFCRMFGQVDWDGRRDQLAHRRYDGCKFQPL